MHTSLYDVVLRLVGGEGGTACARVKRIPMTIKMIADRIFSDREDCLWGRKNALDEESDAWDLIV